MWVLFESDPVDDIISSTPKDKQDSQVPGLFFTIVESSSLFFEEFTNGFSRMVLFF